MYESQHLRKKYIIFYYQPRLELSYSSERPSFRAQAVSVGKIKLLINFNYT